MAVSQDRRYAVTIVDDEACLYSISLRDLAFHSIARLAAVDPSSNIEVVCGLDTVVVVYGTVEGGLAQIDFVPTRRSGTSVLLGKGIYSLSRAMGRV